MVDLTTEPIVNIDSDKRLITLPTELETIAVEGDHLCEEIIFEIPRYFDGEDLSQHTCKVKGINAGNEYFEDENIRIVETANDYIQFGWSLNSDVTRYDGKVEFVVEFGTEVDGVVSYQWGTTSTTFEVKGGLNIEKTIAGNQNTLIKILISRIDKLQKSLVSSGSVVDTTLSVSGAAADAKATGDAIKEVRALINEGSGTNILIDTTLTQEGQAADAKATGDKFKEVTTLINNKVNVIIDTTLTQEGQASDAKVVGNAIKTLQDAIKEIDDNLTSIINTETF